MPPILIFVSILTILFYFRYLWNRRYLYYYGRKVNGPLSLPIIGAFYKFIFADGTQILEIIGALADQYSGFYSIWFGQQLKFVLTIPEYIDKVLINPDAFEKPAEYEFFVPAVGRGVLTATATVWKKSRKLMNTFLGRKYLNDYMKISLKHINQTMNEMKAKLENGESVDVVRAIVVNGLEISFETSFGEKEDLLPNEYHNQPDTFERIMEGSFQRTYIVRYNSDYLFAMTKLGKTVLSMIKRYRDHLSRIIESRRNDIFQQGNLIKRKDSEFSLLHYLSAELKGIEEEYQKDTILDEIATFILTSSDTSTTSMNFVILVLGMFPEIQAKIYEEVIDVFGKSPEPINWKKINELKYLDCVFNETIRLFPIAPFVGRKFLADIKFGEHEEYLLPKGSELIIPIGYIQRSEKYWPDPLKFDPDRFLPDKVTRRHRCTFLPFLHGPRNCVGMLFAQMGVKLTIAHLVREFSFTTDYKSIEEVKLNAGLVLRPKHGFKTHIKLRK